MTTHESDSEVSATVLDHPESSGPHAPRYLYRTASLQERFACFFVDLLLSTYLLGGWALLLGRFFHKDPFEFQGSTEIIWISSSVAFYLLYHLFFEGVFTATPGKMLGRLIIHKKGGGTPSLFAILLRTLFRLVDYPLFFLTGLGMMESTRRCRRLGDLVAGTVVLKKLPFQGNARRREEMVSAGATLRTYAFGVDFVLSVLFLYGILLSIPADRPRLSFILLNLVPLMLLLYLALAETIFQSTFGKVIFGLKVVQEDGSRPSFSLILVRNFFRIVDMNPLGYLCALLSSRKQRPGDIAAGTRVIHAPRNWRGWMVVPYMLLLTTGAVVGGWFQPGSFYRQGYHLRVGGQTFELVPHFFLSETGESLRIEQLVLQLNEGESSGGAPFHAGDLIAVSFRLAGFEPKSDRAWVQVDLLVRDPRRNVILSKANIINSGIELRGKKDADLSSRFALHPEAAHGRYELELTVRDRLAKTTLFHRVEFQVE
ncbi:MAG: RDD family protein [Deltaproteobacteria bacterium]|nr:RDD family protein [Deltaproteobacteria bacterium]